MPSNDKARRRKHAVRLTEINEKLAQTKLLDSLSKVALNYNENELIHV